MDTQNTTRDGDELTRTGFLYGQNWIESVEGLHEILAEGIEKFFAFGENQIPVMWHRYGEVWRQPKREDIKLNGAFACMSEGTFRQLREYSASNPTGVYEGKMWKRHDGAFDQEFLAGGGKPVWLLCWYTYGEKPDTCQTSMRKIRLMDADGRLSEVGESDGRKEAQKKMVQGEG